MLLAAYVFLYAAMAYAFALDDETGRWQTFLALPLWALLLGVSIAMLYTRTLAPVFGLTLLGLAVIAPLAARQLSPLLRPLASARAAAAGARQREASEDLRREHLQRLKQVLTARQRVLRASHGYLLLEGGFAVHLHAASVADADALQHLVGKCVAVRLPDDFLSRYAPSMQSGVTSGWPGVRARGFGLIPALVFDGTTLVNLQSAAPGGAPALEALQARYRSEMLALPGQC